MITTIDKEARLRELQYLGYTKLGKIDFKLLSKLKIETVELVKITEKKYPKGELFNLINADVETKLASNDIVRRYLNVSLERWLDKNIVDIYRVSHIIKPFGVKSGIWHQDSAIVDENIHFSLNAWMPLVKSHRLNGCLWIFPGSHISKNFKRQFGFNPIKGNILKQLKKYFVPINIEAGEVLLFHRNLIHGSSINFLPMKRIAIESVVVSKSAQLLNFHRDDKIAKNKILAYHVDQAHFLKNNPKEDFYNGLYPCKLLEDESISEIGNYLSQNVPLFINHAKQFYQ